MRCSSPAVPAGDYRERLEVLPDEVAERAVSEGAPDPPLRLFPVPPPPGPAPAVLAPGGGGGAPPGNPPRPPGAPLPPLRL